jgi:hypothetical protein
MLTHKPPVHPAAAWNMLTADLGALLLTQLGNGVVIQVRSFRIQVVDF